MSPAGPLDENLRSGAASAFADGNIDVHNLSIHPPSTLKPVCFPCPPPSAPDFGKPICRPAGCVLHSADPRRRKQSSATTGGQARSRSQPSELRVEPRYAPHLASVRSCHHQLG